VPEAFLGELQAACKLQRLVIEECNVDDSDILGFLRGHGSTLPVRELHLVRSNDFGPEQESRTAETESPALGTSTAPTVQG
jgi:hypothetical protein